MTALETMAPRDVLIVAMANKMARIAWAVLSNGKDYQTIERFRASLPRKHAWN